MAYLVNITARAGRDLDKLYNDINARESDAAWLWYQGLKEAILSLDNHPNRCPLTPESGKYRHLLYGEKPHVYRVIFRVDDGRDQVEILHIRHGARRPFTRTSLRQLK